ncbi:MAG: glycosyltransferase family 4 protein [Acidithiobacillus sp.]
MTKSIIMNTRVLQSHTTGLQRYALELGKHLGNEIGIVAPKRYLNRAQGNAWEQFYLPMRLRNSVLFSPANTGPLVLPNQVVTVHDVAQLDRYCLSELKNEIDSKSAAWYRFLTPRLVKRAAHIITISEFSKERILAHTGIDDSHITVIPNGVDSRFRPHTPDEVSEQVNGLYLPSRHYVLCVGSLEPRKNLVRLLQAWSRIQADIPSDIWLVLTGKRGNSRVFANAAGMDTLPPRVYLTGYVADQVLPALYAGAMVFAFPSLYEGFGLPPLEAMACGVPVLTGNYTSLPEVVGDAGVMVDSACVDEIATGLLALIENDVLRRDLIDKGLLRAKQFDWSDTAERTWDVLRQVAQT